MILIAALLGFFGFGEPSSTDAMTSAPVDNVTWDRGCHGPKC